MPTYVLTCPACKVTRERFLKVAERPGARCECGTVLETAAEQFSNVGIGGKFKRGERLSRTMAFDPKGIDEIKRDCPSMDFKIRDGEAVPVFQNDAHHKRVMNEFRAAGRRYTQEREAKKAAKRKSVNKKAKVREWFEKSRR